MNPGATLASRGRSSALSSWTGKEYNTGRKENEARWIEMEVVRDAVGTSKNSYVINANINMSRNKLIKLYISF